MAVEIQAAPWLELPLIGGANIYYAPPVGALIVPAVVYRPDEPWIERQQSYRAWIENYVAVVCVASSAGRDGVGKIYELALALKAAIEDPGAPPGWEWKSVGGIVEAEQAGLLYLAAAVRLSFRAQYE